MTRKLLSCTALLLTLTFSSYAVAAPTCQDVIKAADQALKKKDDQIAAGQNVISQCEANAALYVKQVNEKDAELKAWYHNPIILGLLGAVAGGGLVIVLKK